MMFRRARCGQPDPITGRLIARASAITGETGCTDEDFRPMHNYGNVYLLDAPELREVQLSAGFVEEERREAEFPGELHLQQGDGHLGRRHVERIGNGTTVWPFIIGDNYGPLDYDHTHIFNIWYIYNLPRPIHGNRMLATAINDWKLSGWNTYQAARASTPTSNTERNLQRHMRSPAARHGLFTDAQWPDRLRR